MLMQCSQEQEADTSPQKGESTFSPSSLCDLLDCRSRSQIFWIARVYVAGSRSRQKYCLQSPSPASQAEYRRMGLELRASHQYLTQTLLRSHARLLYLPLIQCAPFSSYICPVTHNELFKVLYACQEPV